MADDSKARRFERLVMPHLDAAYNLARWLVRNPDDAEDLVQDGLVRALRYVESCREETARAWVLRIVRNTCFDWLQATAANPLTAFADLDADDDEGTRFTADAFTEPAADPEAQLLTARQSAQVNAIIAELAPEFREILVLREIEGLAYAEIAEIIGVPMGTVMSRLSRARGQFLKEWTKRDG